MKMASMIMPIKDKIGQHEDTIFIIDNILNNVETEGAEVEVEPEDSVQPLQQWKTSLLEGEASVLKRLKKIHENLGHVSPKIMMLTLRRTGAPPEIIEMVKKLKCEVCAH